MAILRNGARVFAGAALFLYTASILLHARPYTVEDLLSSEALGKIVVDTRGRWLVFEKRETFLRMERFDSLSRSDVLRSRLFRVDLRKPAAA